MKVTDPDVIKIGESDLIESIKDDLDFSAVQKILLEKVRSSSFDIKDGAISFDVSGGEIVVHRGQIAFRIDFQLKTEMGIMFDREGNYIPDQDSISTDEIASGEPIDEINEDEFPAELKEDDRFDELEEDEIPDVMEETDIPDEMDDGDISDEMGEDELNPEALLDDLEPLEDEDILGDMEDEESIGELEPLKDLNQDDDFENLLQESREFWGNQEK